MFNIAADIKKRPRTLLFGVISGGDEKHLS